MDEFTVKFNELLEEIKSRFVVAQAMAKNNFVRTLESIESKDKTIDINQIHQLGLMLTATTVNDTKRLVAIIKTLNSFIEID